MKSSNKIIHGLWIGTTLSPLELLTIESFIQHGHEFFLWTYDEISTKLPPKVQLKDANEILDSSKIFRYKFPNDWGAGKGSLAGFSDIFRYKLLFVYGGWWADMDVTCLKPLDFKEEYVFRSHDVLAVVGNIMKCPKGSPLMLNCFNRASKEVDENNQDWFKPIRILNEEIEQLELQKFIQTNLSNQDRWDQVIQYVQWSKSLNSNWSVFHWMNEEWRHAEIPKNQIYARSSLGHLMKKYLASESITWLQTSYLKHHWAYLNYWLNLWGTKGKNWLKNPGVPVFIKRFLKN